MGISALIKRASFSLTGHIVLFLISFGGAESLLFIWTDYSDGILTPYRVLWILFVTCVLAVVGAVLFWYTVSKPLIRRIKKRGM